MPMNRTLVIATIALVAVVMVMSVATPAMAEHNDKSQDPADRDNPCDALDKESNEKSKKGKDRAKANNGCEE